MKKRLLTVFVAVILIASAMGMVACSGGNVYENLAADGYTVKIRYDAGGAVVNETQNVTIVEVFSEKDIVRVNGKSGIKLLSPDDPRRGEGVFKIAKTDGENNYFSPGWYRERTLRVNEKGEALDAYGELTSVSGREQGYVYSGRWDFENDLVDPATLENGEMTLYAAWIPFFTYEIYTCDASCEYEQIGSVRKLDFTFPQWNTRTGKIDMKDMPKIKGMTFSKAYADLSMIAPLDGVIDGDVSFVDIEKGIATQTSVKIYTTWLDGEYIKIFDAEQFVEAITDEPDGKFILGADIDISEVDWRSELFDVTFTGVLRGEGHSICNALYENGEPIWNVNELFMSVDDGAVIIDVTMSDVCDEND